LSRDELDSNPVPLNRFVGLLTKGERLEDVAVAIREQGVVEDDSVV
jgi:hypothetical protein